MKNIFSLFAITFLLISCQGQTTKGIQTLDAKTYAEKLKTTPNAQFLDVRTPQEYSVEHIGNAVNVNWNGDDFVAKALTYDKSKPVFVYCKVGGRSAQAANKLAELGFKEIYNLDGGIMKWNSSGIENPSEKSTKIIGMCEQEYNEMTHSDKKVMVNFYAKWCEPCKKMQPYILKMQSEMKDQIKIVRLDADENKTMLDELKLDGLPVIIVYEDGKEIWRNIGFISEEDLRKHL
jgi:thioredoxin